MINKKYYPTLLFILAAGLNGCNLGGNTKTSNSQINSPQTTKKIDSTYSLSQYPSVIHVNLVNNSSTNIVINVTDSDYLDCEFPGQAYQYNCGGTGGLLSEAKVYAALQGLNIAANSSSQLNMYMNASGSMASFQISPTISLSVYGNGLPLFGIWQDGSGTPNPQNHYSSQYANNILEVANWDSSNGNNSSLFVGSGNTGGLIENNSYSVNSDGSINLTVTMNNTKPFTRTNNSVPGNSLCTTATANCPNTLNSVGVSTLVSDNGLYELVMQSDGNLVIYNDSQKVIWATNTNGSNATYLAIGTDGNLGVYGPGNNVAWVTNTPNQGATYLALGDDGNLGLYKADGTPVWTSNTAQSYN